MVGREYWCDLPEATITLENQLMYFDVDLSGFPGDADVVVFVEEIDISCSNQTNSDQQELRVYRTGTDARLDGTAITPRPIEAGFGAAKLIVRDVRGEAFGAVTKDLFSVGQNVLNGWKYKATYNMPTVILSLTPVGARLVIRLDTRPAAAIDIMGRVKIREIGA